MTRGRAGAEKRAEETRRDRGRPADVLSGAKPVGYEIEVVPGLEEFAESELRARLGGAAEIRGRPREGRLEIAYAGEPRRLDALRTATAVYATATFDVPRPKALLGHEHVSRLVRFLDGLTRRYPPGTFASFRLSAAGADTPVFARLKAELADQLGLASATGEADLLVAIRHPPGEQSGWQILARTSPRPLSARAWRRCNLPGALNATVAHVMVELAGPSPAGRFLNLACGSGTLLVERLELGRPRRAVGVDLAWEALACAGENLAAGGFAGAAGLVRADATRLPFPSASFDTIVADLPYGMLVGSARENERLYPALLAEAARVAAPGASLILITASKQLVEHALHRYEREWALQRTIPLKVSFARGYLHPSIYHVRRTA